MLTASRDIEVREGLLKRLSAAREQTDKLFRLLDPGALYDRPIPERHRIIFYRGHLEAFDWNLLQPRIPELNVSDGDLDRLFAFGIDPVDGGLPSDQPSDWPAATAVERYACGVRATLDKALARTSFADWGGEESPSQILNVAIEHRLMHAETLAYMLHQLPAGKMSRDPQVSVTASDAFLPGLVEIPRGAVILGLSRNTQDFGWDNEYDAHSVDVPAFFMDRYKVTNGQYLEFLRAGGYQEPSLWAEADWNWIRQQQIHHPVFWRPDGSAWRYRGMFEEIDLPLDWPVYVSHAEASAYARWAGKRLPTEAEWQRAAYGRSERKFPWGDENPAAEHGYFDFRRWDPWPVHAVPRKASAFGVEGLLANGWEWTSSLFEPFEGFRPFPFYEGYSANFFDGKHFVLLGGSPRTDKSMLRRSFRNWFQPHYQYVYSGFRCVQE